VAPDPALSEKLPDQPTQSATLVAPQDAQLVPPPVPIEPSFPGEFPIPPPPFGDPVQGDATVTLPLEPALPEVNDPEVEVAAISAPPLVATRQVSTPHLAGILCAAGLGLWMLVSTLLTRRLGAAWSQLACWRRTAPPADSEPARTCQTLSTLLRV